MDSAPRLARHNRRPTRRTIKYLAPLVAAIALAGVEASHSASDSFTLEGAGINSSAGLVTDPTVAQAEVSKLDELGGNTIEITIPYTQGGVDIKHDQVAICNDVNAAVTASKDIVLRDADHFRNRSLGYVPATASELNRLYSRDVALIDTLVGPNGCAKDLKHLYYSPLNEPNNDRFNHNQAEAAQHFVNLYSYINRLLPPVAEQNGLDLEIVVGELAQRTAIPFLKEVKKIMVAEHITGTMLGNLVAVHYYFNGQDADPSNSAEHYLQAITQASNQTFNKMSVWVTEVGEISKIPSSLSSHYAKLPSSIKPVSPEQQGQDIGQFMFDAAAVGVKRVLNFELQDDGTALRTGLIYNSTSTPVGGQTKASFAIVQGDIQQLVPQK